MSEKFSSSTASMIRPTFKRFSSSSFVRSVATLSSGQMISALIPFLAAPILGRLYLPSEYGVLAIYMSIASVLAGIGNWQFAQGIIVEGRDINAEVLLRLCMLTSAITALVALFIALAIVTYSNLSPEWQQARLWFLALPASTLIGGIVAAWTAMANRHRMYRSMATIQVITVSLAVTASIIMGIKEFGYAGLLVSHFFGQLVAFFAYGYLMSKRKRKYKDIGKNKILAMGRKHKDFALFTSPSAFIGNFSMQLPTYALTLMGSVDVIGLFSRARQLLTMPITLLGGSIAQVFQRQAAEEYAANGNCRKIFRKTFYVLAGPGLILTMLLAIWAPDIFELFLGSSWRGAGNVARILAPMLYLRLICNPLSTTFFVTNSQREAFLWSIVNVALIIVLMIFSVNLNFGSLGIIGSFSIGYSITYMIYLYRSYQLSKGVELSS